MNTNTSTVIDMSDVDRLKSILDGVKFHGSVTDRFRKEAHIKRIIAAKWVTRELDSGEENEV